MEVIARTDTSKPSARKIIRELENKTAGKIEYPLPENISGTLEDNVDVVFDKLVDRLNNHYGTNFKL